MCVATHSLRFKFEMDSWLQQVGDAYLADPSRCWDLLSALSREPDERCVSQSWLNAHWHVHTSRRFLTAVYEGWKRRPEPFGKFLDVCWANNCEDWHDMLDADVIEDDPALAAKIYRRFQAEGPTVPVQRSMIRLLHAGDYYAVDMVANMVRVGMARAPSLHLLRLWQHYSTCCDIGGAAVLGGLATCLSTPELTEAAMKVVYRLSDRQIAEHLLDAIAAVSAGNLSMNVKAKARRVLRRLSWGSYCQHVADAVQRTPFSFVLVDQLSTDCKYQMGAYLRDNNQVLQLLHLYENSPYKAVSKGLFTHLLELSCWPETNKLQCLPLATCAHTALYTMCALGIPLAYYIGELARTYPKALETASHFLPAVAKAYKWQQRRVLLCSLQRASSVSARQEYDSETKRLAQTGTWSSFLLLHPEIWPHVVVYCSHM